MTIQNYIFFSYCSRCTSSMSHQLYVPVLITLPTQVKSFVCTQRQLILVSACHTCCLLLKNLNFFATSSVQRMIAAFLAPLLGVFFGLVAVTTGAAIGALTGAGVDANVTSKQQFILTLLLCCSLPNWVSAPE